MHSFSFGHRALPVSVTTLALLCAAILLPLGAGAQTQSASFELRPHCDSADYRTAFKIPAQEGTTAVPDSSCPSYSIKDPTSLQTDPLKAGDALDMDLILKNPGAQAVTRFSAWIAYDPTMVEGEVIDASTLFPTPTPGEETFSLTDGYIKVTGTADQPQNGTSMIVAHIRLHVLPGAQTAMPMTFYDATSTTASHTAIIVKNGTQETNILSGTLGSLLVQFVPSATPTQSSSSAASQASSEMQSMPSMSSAASVASQPSTPATSGVFNLLQVQHVRVTTEGGSVFLAWDVLPSAELAGYNVYYGTVSGQYIQRRSVEKKSTTITIRALPIGVTYYFAVRGINAKNEQTDFSQEVGISVGNPATSTSPLAASAIERSPDTPQTGGTISGETGSSSVLVLFLVLSAVIGTGLAFRRQLSARL